jgi:hypothetical protein
MISDQNKIVLQDNPENEELSIKDILINIKGWFFYLKAKWKIIIISALLGSVIGLVVAIFDKPSYKATLTFAMEEDKGGGGLSGAIGLASSFGIDLGAGGGGGAFAATNLTELMKSRLIVEKVLLSPVTINGKINTLAEYYIQINNLREKWHQNPTLRNINFLPYKDRSRFSIQQDSILKEFHKNILEHSLSIMQKDKKVTILSIDVITIDEQFSKIFCENIAKETSDFYIETKSKKARINAEVLQKQVDSVRHELNTSITGVARETDNVYNLNPALNIRGAASKKKQIDVQANTAILTNLVVQSELAKITLRKETPLIQIIDKPILPLDNLRFRKSISLIFGAIVAIFISVLFLILIRVFKNITS